MHSQVIDQKSFCVILDTGTALALFVVKTHEAVVEQA
jgi:hypothetical protein